MTFKSGIVFVDNSQPVVCDLHSTATELAAG